MERPRAVSDLHTREVSCAGSPLMLTLMPSRDGGVSVRPGSAGTRYALAREHGAPPALGRLHAYLIEIQDGCCPKASHR